MSPRFGTVEYFMKELLSFRAAMGDRRYSIEKLDKMFTGLFLVAIRTKGEELPGWDALCVEWPRRRVLMLLQEKRPGRNIT